MYEGKHVFLSWMISKFRRACVAAMKLKKNLSDLGRAPANHNEYYRKIAPGTDHMRSRPLDITQAGSNLDKHCLTFWETLAAYLREIVTFN